MAVEAGKFSCTACGRQYAWKAELAGRSAKCKCGAVMRVPEVMPGAAQDEDAGLYELAAGAEEARPAAQAASAPVVRPATVAAAGKAPGRAIGYENPKVRAKESGGMPEDKLTDPVRDLYVPLGMLVVGFLAVVAWGMREISSGAEGIVIVSLGIGVTTLVKTVVVTGLALVFAPALGIGFGTLGSGILKFAAILILTDAALLWLDVIMQATGAVPSSGQTSRGMRRGIWYVNVMTSVAIISFASWYLFNMDSEETGMFAVPLAIVSWIVGFVLKLITFAILSGMAAAASAPAPAAAPAGGPAGTPAGGGGAGGQAASPAPVVATVEGTDRDGEIDEEIRRAGMRMMDGLEWRRDNLNGNNRKTAELIEALYSQAGVQKVYVMPYSRAGMRLYVRLPEELKAHQASDAKVRSLAQGAGFTVDTAGGETKRYLVLVAGEKK